MLTASKHLDGWVPAAVRWREAEPYFEWCHIGNKRFTEPFFDHTIEACLSRPFNSLIRPLTSLSVLHERHDSHPGLLPTGFIFHLSRCGSTLISQMLSALASNHVISEASPIGWMLRAHTRRPWVTDGERISWLRWVVSALGQKRHATARHYFIKFEAWHTLDLPLLAEAFPDTPWLFLYREPLEVMVSLAMQGGSQIVPGILDLQREGIHLEDAQSMPREEYCARALARICQAALTHKDNPRGLLVNYMQLPDFVTTTLLTHFRLTYSASEIAQVMAAARFNAKTPSLAFKSDSDEKRRRATDEIRRVSARLLSSLYEQLETARVEHDSRSRQTDPRTTC
jgi:hypothetical protein